MKASAEEKEEIRKNFRHALQVDSLDEVDITSLMNVLEAENLIERLEYRKASSTSGAKKFIKMKGKRLQEESGISDTGNLNHMIGFKSTMYSVTESSGFIEITI